MPFSSPGDFPDPGIELRAPASLALQEMRVQSMGQENPLEKEMAAHSSILAWKTPRMEEPGELQSMVSQRVGRD